METILFWVLPVLLMLIGIKGRLIVGWRLFFCGAAALYIGTCVAPSLDRLLDFVPANIADYRVGIALTGGFVIVFALLYGISRGLAGKSDEFDFPVIPMMILNAVFRFGFGVVLSTLLFTLCAATPLRGFTRVNGDGFQAGANTALLRFTVACDMLTRFAPPTPRAETLERMWFPRRPLDADQEEDSDEDEADNQAAGNAPSGNAAPPAAPAQPPDR